MISRNQLRRIMPHASPANIDRFLEPLNAAMDEFGIDTPERQAAFLAQLAHESGSLRYVRELASGEAYEGREDLGNTEPGDGPRFKGRGLIQITGRHNYQKCGEALGADFISDPEMLEDSDYASRSAAWFWKTKGLNSLADADNYLLISKRINGVNRKTGLPNGWKDRQEHWAIAKDALGVRA